MGREAGTGFAIAAIVVAVTTTLSPIVFSDTGAAADIDHSPRAPIQLTVDDEAAPPAVVGPPRFGWVPSDPDRGEVQTAYELMVSEGPIAGGDAKPIWRSHKVKSSQQSYVTARRLHVKADRSYTWAVRTWDSSDRVSGFLAAGALRRRAPRQRLARRLDSATRR